MGLYSQDQIQTSDDFQEFLADFKSILIGESTKRIVTFVWIFTYKT